MSLFQRAAFVASAAVVLGGCSYVADLDGYTFGDHDATPGVDAGCADDDMDGVCNEQDRCTAANDALLGTPCTRTLGTCSAQGQTECAPDGTTVCDAAIAVGAWETCNNGLDDDCLGGVDDGCDCDAAIDTSPRTCGLGVGACALGNQVCVDSGSEDYWGDCTGGLPAPEVCDDGDVSPVSDQDCDGLIDEGDNACGGVCTLSGSSLPGTPCDGADTDLCLDGVMACSGLNETTCADGEGSVVEVCGDSLDNDCDGYTDGELAHDYCVAGVSLTRCDSCAAAVCAFDPYYAYCCQADDLFGWGWDLDCAFVAAMLCAGVSCS